MILTTLYTELYICQVIFSREINIKTSFNGSHENSYIGDSYEATGPLESKKKKKFPV